MKHFIHFIVAAIFVAVLLVNAHAGDGGILSVLRSNGLHNYAKFLETHAPLTLAKLKGRTDITCFAVCKEAPVDPPRHRNTTLQRRDPTGEAQAAQQMTDDSAPPPAKMKRQQYLSDSNFQKRRTFLNDPAFINIGSELLSLVTNYASPQNPGDNGADMEITTGLGKIINATGEPIKFKQGIIYVIDDWFILPGLLSETLQAAGAASFLAAIIKENLKSKLDSTPRITVFAPLSKMGSNHSVEGQVIYNFLGYTPDFVPGQTYGGITITKERGQLFANGARIIKGNVPIKNGVVHFVDKLVKSMPSQHTPNATSSTDTSSTGMSPTGTLSTGISSSATGTPPPVATGAAAILNGAPNMVFGVMAFGLGLWIAI
ncbi:hypothetical protein BDD12DRAFT_877933 [Trichophaea hybrida]|nr:hypothetical protein BDD12DRAFT_877933 [Trichophaea hybrida]